MACRSAGGGSFDTHTLLTQTAFTYGDLMKFKTMPIISAEKKTPNFSKVFLAWA